MKINFKTVDKYISSFPEDIQEILKELRALVKEISPEAEEGISYGMPAYKLNKKPLVYFAAYKSQIGFYPTPSGTEKFEKELSKYKTSKGTAQFKLNEPIPYGLVKKIIEFRVKENEAKSIES